MGEREMGGAGHGRPGDRWPSRFPLSEDVIRIAKYYLKLSREAD